MRQMQCDLKPTKLTGLGEVLTLSAVCLCRLQKEAPHLCWQEVLAELQQKPRHLGQVLGGAQGAE